MARKCPQCRNEGEQGRISAVNNGGRRPVYLAGVLCEMCGCVWTQYENVKTGEAWDVRIKKRGNKLSSAQAMRLLREIQEYDLDIEPISLRELAQIEAEFETDPPEPLPPEVMESLQKRIRELIEAAKEDRNDGTD